MNKCAAWGYHTYERPYNGRFEDLCGRCLKHNPRCNKPRRLRISIWDDRAPFRRKRDNWTLFVPKYWSGAWHIPIWYYFTEKSCLNYRNDPPTPDTHKVLRVKMLNISWRHQ